MFLKTKFFIPIIIFSIIPCSLNSKPLNSYERLALFQLIGGTIAVGSGVIIFEAASLAEKSGDNKQKTMSPEDKSLWKNIKRMCIAAKVFSVVLLSAGLVEAGVGILKIYKILRTRKIIKARKEAAKKMFLKFKINKNTFKKSSKTNTSITDLDRFLFKFVKDVEKLETQTFGRVFDSFDHSKEKTLESLLKKPTKKNVKKFLSIFLPTKD